MLLKKKGLKCDHACDGEEAIEAFKNNPNKFDFIFMDNMMPNMNGIEATRTLRALGYSKIILGLTGNTMEDEILDFENAGADLIFPKPLKSPQFDIVLEHMKSVGTETTIGTRCLKKKVFGF